jgi:hypothetical protein
MNNPVRTRILLIALIGGAAFSFGYFYPEISHALNQINALTGKQTSQAQAPNPDNGRPIPTLIIRPSPEPTEKPKAKPSGKPTQFVIFSFDGSESPQMWRDTIDFADHMTASGSPVRFTYFVSGVYFLDYPHKYHYAPPQNPKGTSYLGFAYGKNDILRRVRLINEAASKGNEISSHANGHFNGSAWSLADWNQELSAFKDLLFSAGKNIEAPNPESYQLNLGLDGIAGFRAPNLGRNSNLMLALKENGFRYDASTTGREDGWPYKLENGLWEIPLPTINFAGTNSKLIAMDYNFYVKQSGAVDVAKKGTPVWEEFYDQTLQSYRDYFSKNYEGSRAPVFSAGHFSLWNDGVYFEAMKQFATEVCGKPEVKCGTYTDLLNYAADKATGR